MVRVSDNNEVRGNGVSSGVAFGIPRRVENLEDIEENVILVSKKAESKMVRFIDSVDAMVTEEGGEMCHLAIICREANIPYVFDADVEGISDFEKVKVDGESGLIEPVD